MTDEPSMHPLPFVTPPPPRPSLSECMLMSTFLFPVREGDMTAHSEDASRVGATERRSEPRPRSVGADRRPTAKKSVIFDAAPCVYHPIAPRASDMTADEKRDVWYCPGDYDRFKFQAAEDAGFRIARHGTDFHRFVVTGRCFNGGDGGARCQRGLNYHFSRRRKRDRSAVPASVLAWQARLRGQATAGDRRLLLAHASERLSHIAREEAWRRGEADREELCQERRQALRGDLQLARRGSRPPLAPRPPATSCTTQLTPSPVKRRRADGCAFGATVDLRAGSLRPRLSLRESAGNG